MWWTRRPWHSAVYNDVIGGLSPVPWGMTEEGVFSAGHQEGQKQYELTNHLGNVQATITDLPVPQGEHDIDYRAPALAALPEEMRADLREMAGRVASLYTEQAVTNG